MYCVKCGVELGDSEKKCPLCNTPVYFPDHQCGSESTYPPFEKGEKMSRTGSLFIVSFLFLIASVISLLCDKELNGGITWSGYAVFGILLLYVIVVLPWWFRKPSPAIFIPSDFAAIAAYVFYVEYATGGNWYFEFALPIIVALAVIISTPPILIYYIRCGRLYIIGGTFIALAAFSYLVEYLLHKKFGIHDHMTWAPYPMAALSMLGLMLIVIAIVPSFRESLRKKLFL